MNKLRNIKVDINKMEDTRRIEWIDIEEDYYFENIQKLISYEILKTKTYIK